MNWGPIDPDWGEGWEDFDSDPFTEEASARPPLATVTRLPRVRRGTNGARLDRSLTAPTARARPTVAPRPRHALDGSAADHRVGPGVVENAGPPPVAAAHASGGGGGRRPPTRRARTGRPGRRALLLQALLTVLLLAVVGKLVHVQVVEPDRLVARGEQQRLRTVSLEANRGRILDRDGHELALSVLRPTVFADPSQVTDPVATAELLAPVLGRSVGEVAEALSVDGQFAYLQRWVDDDLAAAVVELDLEGIHLLEEPSRFTPSGTLARAIIGRVASDETGATGIELLYDDVLTGTPGEVTYERAQDGSTIAAAGQTRVAPRAGSDVVLTLDRSLQYEAERVLAEQVDAMGAKGGTVVISEPNTGEILALANITRNTDGEIITAGANRAVIDVFEPGSVNKMITIAAALEEEVFTPDSILEVPWRYQVSDHLFSDDHQHPTDPMTVTRILAASSNVGTIQIGQALGKDRIDEYLRAFGFGSSTALAFPNESKGLLLPPEQWSGTSIGSIPIGQGIAVTAIQMLMAYNVIANDGMYVEPRLVAATVAADGARTPIPPSGSRRVVSARTAQQVRGMLVEAVEDGTGRNARVPGYTVAGKTGTARKPQDTGTYQDLAGNYHYVAAFTGMVPAENPSLSIIVAIDEPTATIYGGSAAAPVFADLAAFALNRFRIPPAGR